MYMDMTSVTLTLLIYGKIYRDDFDDFHIIELSYYVCMDMTSIIFPIYGLDLYGFVVHYIWT